MNSFKFCYSLLLLLFAACQSNDYAPKPRGFFRIKFPDKQYKVVDTGCPYTFEQPTYALLVPDRSQDTQPCWQNLDFPEFNARLHISYFAINPIASFNQLSEDARTFAFKHTAKATAIDQERIIRPEANVYGLTYSIKGNTASNIQFFVSDSTKHYLRAALYFNEKPHLDSIQPVLDFLRKDIEHMVSTISWK